MPGNNCMPSLVEELFSVVFSSSTGKNQQVYSGLKMDNFSVVDYAIQLLKYIHFVKLDYFLAKQKFRWGVDIIMFCSNPFLLDYVS